MDRIGDEIERELARSGSRDALPLAALTAAWPEVVGDAVARRAWPLRIGRDGTLHVATASATWAHELDLLGAEILRAARRAAGRRRAIQAAVCSGAATRATGSLGRARGRVRSEPAEVPPETAAEATAAAAAIDDPELRELVARAARASLLKARSGRHFW